MPPGQVENPYSVTWYRDMGDRHIVSDAFYTLRKASDTICRSLTCFHFGAQITSMGHFIIKSAKKGLRPSCGAATRFVSGIWDLHSVLAITVFG